MNLRPTILMGSIALTSIISTSSCTKKEEHKRPKNILLIAIDDLRPELNCFGHTGIISPNIDQLAAQGTSFQRAYCNIPVSGASRSSLLTGTRPTRNTFLGAGSHASKDKKDKIAINDYLKANGYRTEVRGKVFHSPEDHRSGWDSVHVNKYDNLYYLSAENKNLQNQGLRGAPYECVEAPDDAYCDGSCAQEALKDLERLSKSDQPFFYALGFFKPHLPFNAPKKYWDLYKDSLITLPDNYILKEGNNIPKRALTTWGELRRYHGIPAKGAVSDSTAITLIRAYRACVSYVDAQIGLIIEQLEKLGIADETAIVLFGDHGWNLGDHSLWCKHTILETCLHAPLIVYDPTAQQKGYRCNEIVEFVDIFPTLCEIAELDIPQQAEGESLIPLINDTKAQSKGYAVSRWMQGYTLVTNDSLFYTEWWNKEDEVIEKMLFDHRTDPNENYNIANLEENQKLTEKLGAKLKALRGAEFDKY